MRMELIQLSPGLPFKSGLISIILGFTCQICKLPYMAICLLLRLFPPGFIYWDNIYMSKMLRNLVLNIILSTLISIFSFYIIQTFILVYFLYIIFLLIYLYIQLSLRFILLYPWWLYMTWGIFMRETQWCSSFHHIFAL